MKKNSWSSMALAIFIALTVRWSLAEAYVIPSGSMLPTLLINDHIFVNKLTYGVRVPFTKTWIKQFRLPSRGEVVVFKDPRNENINLIKRVVGLPGDKILYENEKLYINDKLVKTMEPPKLDDFADIKDKDLENQPHEHKESTENLGSHSHFILTRKTGSDRSFGPLVVPQNSFFVLGDHRDNSADSRYWGFAPIENILGKAEFVWLSCRDPLPLLDAGCMPTTVRWGRFFEAIN